MIKHFLQFVLLLACFVALPSWAILITDTNAGGDNGANVGLLDTFVIEEAKVNGEAAELAWVNDKLGAGSVSWVTKYDPVPYFETNADDTFAFKLADGVDYFLVKNATRIALFENLADLSWGVFDTDLLSGSMNLPDDEYEISHVSQFTGGVGTTRISEPNTVILLAMALLCLLITRRKKTL